MSAYKTLNDVPEYQPRDDARGYYEKHGYYGVMEPETFDDPVRQVEEMYGDADDTPSERSIDGKPRRSLAGHTKMVKTTSDIAQQMVSAVPSYNYFDPDHVAEAVDKMPESYIAVGREGSPVLYIWTDQAQTVGRILNEIRGPHKTDDGSRISFTASPPDELGVPEDPGGYPVQVIGESVKRVGNGKPVLVRAWWD